MMEHGRTGCSSRIARPVRQLGNGTTTTEKEPVEVKGITEAVAIAAGSDHSLAVLKSGKVVAWGDNNDGQLGNGTTTTEKEPVEVKGITEATGVAGERAR